MTHFTFEEYVLTIRLMDLQFSYTITIFYDYLQPNRLNNNIILVYILALLRIYSDTHQPLTNSCI